MIKRTFFVSWVIGAFIVGIGFSIAILYFFEIVDSKQDVTVEEIEVLSGQSVGVWSNFEEDTKIDSSYDMLSDLPAPNIQAPSFLVADIKSGDVLLERGIKDIWPIASITKLVTALTSFEYINQYRDIYIDQKIIQTEGHAGDLALGDTLRVGTLVYPLLLESSNDAAEAIASSIDREWFIGQMKEVVDHVGMKSTRIVDPSGLSASNTSTAQDLFTLIEYIYHRNPAILDILQEDIVSHKKYVWENRSAFIGNTQYLGGKNGFIPESLHTFVGVFEVKLPSTQRNIAIILLRSKDRTTDIEKILSYIQRNFDYH